MQKGFKPTWGFEVDSQLIFETTTSKQSALGRSIVGEILAGETGAIIGTMTVDEISVSRSNMRPKKLFLIYRQHIRIIR